MHWLYGKVRPVTRVDPGIGRAGPPDPQADGPGGSLAHEQDRQGDTACPDFESLVTQAHDLVEGRRPAP